jgi:type IV secretion system protein VirB1
MKFRAEGSASASLPGANVCKAIAAAALLIGSGNTATAEQISLQAFYVLAENCAPSVAPEIMEKLVRIESGFNRFAIGVNGAERRSHTPTSRDEAVQIARELIGQGHSIDMGLGQINSANLEWLGLTVDAVFDSCTNLKAAERVLRDGYERARKQGSDPEEALHQALSAYNTGTFTRGFSNGYVERVIGADVEAPTALQQPSTQTSAPTEATPAWDVFSGGMASTALVFNEKDQPQ